jgi:hypothetical protein
VVLDLGDFGARWQDVLEVLAPSGRVVAGPVMVGDLPFRETFQGLDCGAS